MRNTIEESGTHTGSGEYRWIVDPLDGTNNVAAGLPAFASAVAVLRDDEAIVAAVSVPVTGETYLASRGEGITYDGETDPDLLSSLRESLPLA